MTVRGSTLNFNKESQVFAKALQAEHSALGDLLEKIGGITLFPEQKEAFDAAQKAHEAVRFQRTRTEAARGRR